MAANWSILGSWKQKLREKFTRLFFVELNLADSSDCGYGYTYPMDLVLILNSIYWQFDCDNILRALKSPQKLRTPGCSSANSLGSRYSSGLKSKFCYKILTFWCHLKIFLSSLLNEYQFYVAKLLFMVFISTDWCNIPTSLITTLTFYCATPCWCFHRFRTRPLLTWMCNESQHSKEFFEGIKCRI